MKGIHGGDIYRNEVQLDFSVNVNPLGMPDAVREALKEAIEVCERYPDIQADALKQTVSGMLGVKEKTLIFGNGASELFMAIVHAKKPKKTVIPVPSFYGYEYAASAVGSEICYVELPFDGRSPVLEPLLHALTDEVELLFLANPNNPTGTLLTQEELEAILTVCREKDILVVLDECFIEFCREGASMVSKIEQYPNLLIVRAFTKIYAIPGVRLGYLVGSDAELLLAIQKQLPEWNLSTFAQKAGIACGKQQEYLAKTVDYIERERQILTENLKSLGLQVFPSAADFILIYSELPLYEQLLQKGILIRDCQNFRGLRKGYYRVAVKKREDNEILWKVMGECIESNRTIIAGRN